mmetsp:Transcript_28217/g.27180  ORF Transcript_28217/g.27180 Transcript_28217/m.27180 type:complete len:98 (-) Transcript_28217:43-336(-)
MPLVGGTNVGNFTKTTSLNNFQVLIDKSTSKMFDVPMKVEKESPTRLLQVTIPSMVIKKRGKILESTKLLNDSDITPFNQSFDYHDYDETHRKRKIT